MASQDKSALGTSEDRIRSVPKQARGKARVRLILQGAKDVLREDGIRSLTTTAIAARAGIPVSSIYQYFPDKKAILVELYTDYLNKVLRTFDEVEKRYDPDLGWESFFKEFYQLIHRAELRDEIHNELAKALHLYPELQAIDRKHQQEVIERNVSILQTMGSKWQKPKLRRLAAFLYNINSGIWSYRAQGLSSERELQDWEMAVWSAAVNKCFK